MHFEFPSSGDAAREWVSTLNRHRSPQYVACGCSYSTHRSRDTGTHRPQLGLLSTHNSAALLHGIQNRTGSWPRHAQTSKGFTAERGRFWSLTPAWNWTLGLYVHCTMHSPVCPQSINSVANLLVNMTKQGFSSLLMDALCPVNCIRSPIYTWSSIASLSKSKPHRQCLVS